jgi:imidazolonepropionase-like amidohydrolase
VRLSLRAVIRQWRTTAIAFGVAACAGPPPVNVAAGDLVITHASVLDVTTGSVLLDHNVVITDGVITAVTPDSAAVLGATIVLDARGRLLTPGFIDAHFHLCNIYGPPHCTSPRNGRLRLVMKGRALLDHRRHLASLYLPYGVTTVRDAGTDERHLPLMRHWMQRSADAPDFYSVGAHLISPDINHTHAPWQVEVADSAAAAQKVRDYHALGIRNIKLYWRLREPAFQGALYEAKASGMHVAAHVDYNIVSVTRALELGVRDFEHVLPWALAGLTDTDFAEVYNDVVLRTRQSDSTHRGAFYLLVPEEWNRAGPDNPSILALINRLKDHDASVTPTLHIFAQRYGLAWFSSPARDPDEDTGWFSATDSARAVTGYGIMAAYVKLAWDKGVRLNIGTDTPEPGKSVLSEMLLLHDAGIPMTDVFRIATLNSARGIGHEADYGSITPGKRANLVLFDGDPLSRPRDLLGARTVIKDGVVYTPTDSGRR